MKKGTHMGAFLFWVLKLSILNAAYAGSDDIPVLSAVQLVRA